MLELRTLDLGRTRGQLGPAAKCILQQVEDRRIQGDQVDRNQRPSHGAEPDGRVEIEPIGEPGRSDGHGFLSADHGGAVQFPFGLRAIGVGRAPLAGDGKVARDHRDLVNLAFQ